MIGLRVFVRSVVVSLAVTVLAPVLAAAMPLDVWQVRHPSPLTVGIDAAGMAYGNGRFVAVGSDRYVYVSTDGLTWQEKQVPFHGGLFQVQFLNGLFVALRSRGVVCTSPDAETWTAHNVASDVTIKHVSYGNGRWVVLGVRVPPNPSSYEDVDTLALVSTDLQAWSETSLGTWSPCSLRFGNGRFVALSKEWKQSAAVLRSAILWSEDGVDWRQGPEWTLTANLSLALDFAGGLFFCHGATTNEPEERLLLVARSADGAAWENVVASIAIPSRVVVNQVAYGAGRYVLVGLGGTLGASPDGLDWTMSTSYDFSGDHLHGVIYATGRFVAHNVDSAIFVSDDGLSWATAVPGVRSNSEVKSVAWGNGTFVAVGPVQPQVRYSVAPAQGVIMTSQTGRTWTKRAAEAYFLLTKVAFGGGVFVALGGQPTGRILASSDGITWRNVAARLPERFLDVAYGNGCFVALGAVPDPTYGGAYVARWSLYRSADGIRWQRTWTSTNLDTTSSLTFCGGRFVVFAYGGRALVSRDGRVWASRGFRTAGGRPLAPTSLAYGDGRFVAVGAILSSSGDREGVIATSPDLLNWRTVPTPERDWTPVVFGYGNFVRSVERLDGLFLRSSRDGITWTTRLRLHGYPLSITTGRRTFLLTGSREFIAQSAPFPY